MSESIMTEALAVSQIVGELDRIQLSLDEIRRKLNVINAKEPHIQFDEGDTKLEDVKKAAAEVLQLDGGREYLLNLLHSNGAKKLSELQQANYGKVLFGLKSWHHRQTENPDIPF